MDSQKNLLINFLKKKQENAVSAKNFSKKTVFPVNKKIWSDQLDWEKFGVFWN